MKRPRCERDVEGVEHRMKHANLVGAGCQALDLEIAGRIGDKSSLHAFDDHVGARQVASVEAVDHHTGDLGCGLGNRWGRGGLLLCNEPSAGIREGEHGNELERFDRSDHVAETGWDDSLMYGWPQLEQHLFNAAGTRMLRIGANASDLSLL